MKVTVAMLHDIAHDESNTRPRQAAFGRHRKQVRGLYMRFGDAVVRSDMFVMYM